MAEIVPFHGLRYDEAKAGALGDLICPPYDVISEDDRDRLYERSEHNFVRIEYGLAEAGEDPYAHARSLIERWGDEGVLRYDTTPAFYLYDHYFEVDGRRARRRGFLGALRLYQMGRGVVRPHERTTPRDKEDRLRLLRATRVNTSPIFGLYDDPRGRIAALLEDWTARGPARFVGEARSEHERHMLWALDDGPPIAKLQAALKDARVYLADGHHRYEVALEYLKEETDAKRIELPEDTPNFVMAYLCALDDPGLRILPTHRVVRDADAAIEELVTRSFDARPIDRAALDGAPPAIVLARAGRLTALEPRADAELATMPASWRDLPVAWAEALLLDPARATGASVSYEHDTDRAIALADTPGTTAILLPGVDARALQRVADAWERLPPKTTYFLPKVPAGLVARPLGL